MYSYDYIPTYNENQQFLYYQQQQLQQAYYSPNQYSTAYNPSYQQLQIQQQQFNYNVSPIADVKSIWSSALFLPCLYPYLYEPFDYKYQQPQQQQPQQQIVSSDLNALYEFLINDENKKTDTQKPIQQTNAIRRLNFEKSSAMTKKTDENEFIKNYDNKSLSSDDGYQSGSFDNFVENFNKIQYDNLAAVVANNSINHSYPNGKVENQLLKDVTNQRNVSTSPKPRFIAPRFEKKWLESQSSPKQTQLKQQQPNQSTIKNLSPNNKVNNNNNTYSNSKKQQQQSPYKRTNNHYHQNSPPNNKYNSKQQQQQPINYTKRCNKCSLNFVQCSCSANGKTLLSPSSGVSMNNNKYNRATFQFKARP